MRNLSYDEYRNLFPPKRLILLARERKKRKDENQIAALYPEEGRLRRELYQKHQAFFAAGSTERVRTVMASNRVGKTWGIGCFELVCHMLGVYPSWWVGRRFKRAIKAWAVGDTGKTVRDILQDVLLGPIGSFGTGLIPANKLEGEPTRKAGISDAVEIIKVKHFTGRPSTVILKSYDQGREAFQGTSMDFILLDEEPPIDIYVECLYRTATNNGLVALTFTPLMGVTKLIKHLRESKVWMVSATWDDVPHLSDEAKAELIRNTPPHQLDARTKGLPVLGSGAVFPVKESDITITPIQIPSHWVRISGIDFGWDHFFAWVTLAWDRDLDIVYLVDEYRRREATPKDHVADLREKPGFDWIPVVWPHDGLQHDKQSGVALADAYRSAGLNLLQDKFSNPPVPGEEEGSGGNGVEVGVMSMLTRMQSGRFKVFSTCQLWLQECRQYHREDGKIENIDDDLIAASRYSIQSLRFAETKPLPARQQRSAIGARNW